jgi:ribonuclease HII
MSLSTVYNPENKYEIGVDEAGRGPLFGRLYVAAVIIPDGGFNNPGIKDSKKIKSKKKMTELSALIKKESKAWAIHYIEHDVIDKINIRQAVFQGMHECIKQCLSKRSDGSTNGSTNGSNEERAIDVFTEKTFLLIDGNDFKPYSVFKDDRLMTIPYETIEGGDNKFQAIAAASILAKCARDLYIEELCQTYPELSRRYNLGKNMGYGTKAHLDGLLEHGVTQWHRLTYGRCKEARMNPIDVE